MGAIDLACYRLRKELAGLWSKMLEYVYPTRCVLCEKHAVLLCDKCRQRLPYIEQKDACEHCGAPLGRELCSECSVIYEDDAGKDAFPFTAASCALEFTETSRRLILAYKDKGERRLAGLLADLLAQSISRDWRRWADMISWIPADAAAVKRRGFDHMANLSAELAQILGLSAQPLLFKHSLLDQRGLNRSQRQANMDKVFKILNAQALEVIGNKNILLVDDVFTTGATLISATKCLKSAGASEVRVATLCRVW